MIFVSGPPVRAINSTLFWPENQVLRGWGPSLLAPNILSFPPRDTNWSETLHMNFWDPNCLRLNDYVHIIRWIPLSNSVFCNVGDTGRWWAIFSPRGQSEHNGYIWIVTTANSIIRPGQRRIEDSDWGPTYKVIVFTFLHIPEPNVKKNDNISCVPHVHAKFEIKIFYFSFRKNQSK